MPGTQALRFRFIDRQPAPVNFRDEVLAGLRRPRRSIPPKFFYDDAGSALFEAICGTPEYYLTRTETQILRDHLGVIQALTERGCLLIEPGSGSSRKVRELLPAVLPRTYLPIDISRAHLYQAAEDLAAEFSWLEVHAICADYTAPLDLPATADGAARLAFFPGSTIGNFDPEEAVAFLRNVRAMVGPGGGLIIGVDMKKDAAILNAAYNDAQGMTAQFNMNLLSRIVRELDGRIDPAGFRHHAFYNEAKSRIEMHLISTRDQVIAVAGQSLAFKQGESLHTENSYKYTLEEFQALARRAGFDSLAAWTDADRLFSVHYLQVPPAACA